MKIAIAILIFLLLGSNVYWIYRLIDTGITLTYRDQETYELGETVKQLMAILPEVAMKASKDEVVAAASKHANIKPFEKDGCTWVKWIGFKFDENSKLQSASPSWSYGEKDPCYPSN